MNYRVLILACTFGVSTLLFAGCATNNNSGINVKNVGPGNMIRNTADGMRGLSDAGNRIGSNVARMAGFDTQNRNGTGNRNTGNAASFGAFSAADLNGYVRSLGVPSSNVLVLGNLMLVGVDGNGRFGATAGTARHPSAYGMRVGMAGTDAGTAWNGSHEDALRAQFGRQFRVMKVTDAKALKAMERVRRDLYTAAAIKTHSARLVQDMHYIVSKATDVSSRPGTGYAAGTR